MKLESLDGVGPARAKKLSAAGIRSVEDLASLEPAQVASQAGVSEAVAKRLVVNARNSVSVEPTVATWKIVAVVAVIGVVLFSAYTILSSEELFTGEHEYNGFVFSEAQCSSERSCWSTTVELNIGAREVLFYYGPWEVEDVSVDPAAVERVLNLTYADMNGSVVIVFDAGSPGEVGVAASNLARITGERFYNIPTSGSEYANPVSCEDSSEQRVVIYLVDGPFEGVRLVDDCVLVSASNPEDLFRVVDAYRLRLMQIIQ